MKKSFVIFCLSFCAYLMYGQDGTVEEKGVASYVSSQNVYVKFTSTENINKGDTLWVKNGAQMVPGLVVKDKSSTSCVCSPLLSQKFKAGDTFYGRSIPKPVPEKSKEKKRRESLAAGRDSTSFIKPNQAVVAPVQEDKDENELKQKIKGRVSAASYSNFYNGVEIHRMRYAFTFQGTNLNNSKFSTDNYITFRHTIGEWSAVQDNFFDALKIYSLSVNYDFNRTTRLSAGRKINQRISSMGAIDGLQAEKSLGRFLIGAIAGFRPDYADYGVNFDLLQAGVYVSHLSKNKSQESTVAFVDQLNQLKTDRRFAYIQHSGMLLKNLHFFGSFEVDMFKKVDSLVSYAPSLTNLLVSLRYRISKNISLSAGYDNRKNIIYYESYKSYIDQLIDNETRQGVRFGANYRISRIFTIGFNGSWRFQKSNINLSKNINGYFNVSQLPLIHANASLSANLLQTNYLDSKIYGIRLSKDIIQGKLSSQVYFRDVTYIYKNYENKIHQEIAGADFSWNLTRKLAFHLYYEGTFEPNKATFHRFNSKLLYRL